MTENGKAAFSNLMRTTTFTGAISKYLESLQVVE